MNKLPGRAAALLLACIGAAAQAALVNIDFKAASLGNLVPTQSGAAVFGSAGDVWNGISGASGGAIPLVASDNTASGVSLSFAATNSFAALCGSDSSYCGTAYERLMRDFLVAASGSVGTVTLSGLVANAAYELALYGASNFNRRRITRFTANGVVESTAFNGTDSTLTEDVSYVDIVANADASGRIVITFEQAGFVPGGFGTTAEGNLNGLQIREFVAAAVPEPSSLALAAAALALGLRARRRDRG